MPEVGDGAGGLVEGGGGEDGQGGMQGVEPGGGLRGVACPQDATVHRVRTM